MNDPTKSCSVINSDLFIGYETDVHSFCINFFLNDSIVEAVYFVKYRQVLLIVCVIYFELGV